MIVYVSNADSGDIAVLRLDAAGTLAEVQRVPAGGTVMPLALSPDRRFLHASIRSEPFSVRTFAIDPTTGQLAPIGTAPLPASMCWISTDRAGRFLLSASYGASLIAVSPIGADGVVRPAQQVLPTESNAHAVQVDPSNRFLFATCLGGGVVMQQLFDAATGRVEPNDVPRLALREGAGPRHFAFHPSAPFVYLLNELDAGIDVLAFDRERGRLRLLQTVGTLPPGFSGAPWAADIHLRPDGRFLYSSERRSNTLAAFAVDAQSGELSLVGHVATEAQPRAFNVTPDGRFLLAVGQLSHRLSVYAIDAQGGTLRKLGDCPVGRNPNWIETVDLRA
ncbi:MAG TPA: beta-propeller fold lactonase family protein [Caldimonas sp.]